MQDNWAFTQNEAAISITKTFVRFSSCRLNGFSRLLLTTVSNAGDINTPKTINYFGGTDTI